MRNYIHEWLFHEFSSEAGLIKLKYEFVYLNINGADQGLYVLEENFDKELIERNKRRNGPIFSIYERFSEDIFNSELEIYNKNFWQKKENIQLANAARTKFKSFLEGKITLEEAFDIEKWASYFAVGDLTYTFHGLSHKNVKFYYNPISGLLEPIPYDGHRGNRNYSKHLINFDDSSVFEMARMCLDTKTTNCFDDKNTTASLNFYDYEKKWLYYFFYKNENIV